MMRRFFAACAALLALAEPASAQYPGGYSFGTFPNSSSLGTINAADPAYGVLCDGATNNDAALAAISTAVGTGGYTIAFPRGDCRYTTWALSSLNNIVLQGQGGLSQNTANLGTTLTCTRTDAGTCLTFTNDRGFVVRDIVIAKADAHTGRVVDASSTASTWNKIKFENVEFRRTSGTGRNGTLLYIRNSVDVTLDTVRLSHGANGIVGGDNGETTTGSAVFNCRSCDLVDLTVAVRNPGPFWSFYGGAWEQTLTGAPSGLISQAADTVKAIGFYGVTFADPSAAGTWMTFSGGVWGFTMSGGSMAGVVGVNGISLAGAAAGTQGVSITGVNFAGLDTAITFAGTCSGTVVQGNVYTSVTNRIVNGSGSCYTSNWWPANAPSAFNNAFSGSIYNGQAGADPIWTAQPILGLTGTGTGSLGFRGLTSGTATIIAQAVAGTPTLTLPNASGTVAVSASSPLVLNAATGALTCPTCGGGLTVGTSTIASGTNTRVLFDNAGVLGEYVISGSGNVAMTTSPSFTTPTLGAATATTINKVALTAPATGSTLTIADGKTATHNATTTFAGTDGKTLTISNSGTLAGGDAFTLAIAAAKTLTVSNSLTLAGTDATTMTFPSVSATIPGLAVANTFTANQSLTLSQAAATQISISNTNVSTSATATLNLASNSGTFTASAANNPNTTGSAAFTWSGTGAMFFAATNAAGVLVFDTGGFNERMRAAADGTVIVGASATNLGAAGRLMVDDYAVTSPKTVGGLSTCNAISKGARSFVTDANAAFTAGIGAVVAAGGANNVPVTCDGTNWRIGAVANDNENRKAA